MTFGLTAAVAGVALSAIAWAVGWHSANPHVACESCRFTPPANLCHAEARRVLSSRPPHSRAGLGDAAVGEVELAYL
jgi:hypothetical protein